MIGISGPSKPPRKQPPRRPAIFTLEVPEDWDNAEWLAHAYGVTRSIYAIAKAVGRSYFMINYRLRRYGIPFRTDMKMLHPCRNKRWVEEHYVKQKLTQMACAKLAGVSRDTFTGWLVEFGIPARTITEISASKRRSRRLHVCLWGRKLIHQLKNDPLVSRARTRDRGAIINYRSHIKEVYWFGKAETRKRAFSLTKEDAVLEKVPEVYEQYPEPFGPTLHPIHLIIQKSDWRKSSFIEQRMAFHTMHMRLRQIRWQQPYFPVEILERDLHRLMNYRRGRHLVRGGLIPYRTGSVAGPGWPTVLHHFDMYEHLNPVWSSPSKLWRAMQMVSETRTPLCTIEIIKAATFLYGPRIIPPTLWADILRQLGSPATILDLYPGFGSRAMACAILGLRYRTIPNARFESAMEAGLKDFLGLDWAPYDGGRVDLVVADDSFRDTDLQAALQYADRTASILGFVPYGKLKAASGMGHRATIRVRTRLYAKRDDYLLVW